MTNATKAAIILGAAIIVGCVALGGIYTTSPAGSSYAVIVVNKFTGDASICAASGCRPLGPMRGPTATTN